MALNWMKKGEDSLALAKKEEVLAQQRKENSGKMYRFWLAEKAEAKITFIDGELDAQGFLLPPRFYEHNLFLNGEWNNYFVCPAMTNPGPGVTCPICDSGDKPYLVALFTIIDHRTYQSKDKTKTYVNQRRLFVAKSQTMEILTKIAVKRGGLACCTFDVSRVGDKAASVGTMFDYCEKRDRKELEAMFMDETTDPKTNQKTVHTRFVAADYEKEIPYRTGPELVAAGMGKPQSQVSSPAGSSSAGGPLPDYAAQM